MMWYNADDVTIYKTVETSMMPRIWCESLFLIVYDEIWDNILHQRTTSVRKKTEFLDKFPITVDILPVFFEPKWRTMIPCITILWSTIVNIATPLHKTYSLDGVCISADFQLSSDEDGVVAVLGLGVAPDRWFNATTMKCLDGPCLDTTPV